MFFTIPDITNTPVMLNFKHIESITYESEFTLNIQMVSGTVVQTNMPRTVLVQMLNKMSSKPETVQTHTEFAG